MEDFISEGLSTFFFLTGVFEDIDFFLLSTFSFVVFKFLFFLFLLKFGKILVSRITGVFLFFFRLIYLVLLSISQFLRRSSCTFSVQDITLVALRFRRSFKYHFFTYYTRFSAFFGAPC